MSLHALVSTYLPPEPAAVAILAGAVSVNHRVCRQTARAVGAGDVVVVLDGDLPVVLGVAS